MRPRSAPSRRATTASPRWSRRTPISKTENMNLKIDIGVRKGLLDRAWTQLKEISTEANNLLRENGALQYQIRQIAAPADSARPDQQDDQSGHQEPPQAATFVEAPPVDNTPGSDQPAV